jgi:carboxypeptidase C (cathepsin A)
MLGTEKKQAGRAHNLKNMIMKSWTHLPFLATLQVALACNSKHPDFVPSLPGYNQQPFPSAVYSGHLTYDFKGEPVHTHYILIEAKNDFDNGKPLIYWSNGGPGASSMFGLLTELGPVLLSDLSKRTDGYQKTGIPTPIYNPYTWTRLGSVLIIDQPAPVGFSYCNNDTHSHSCGNISWDDELASVNAHKALKVFYDKFPCFENKHLYSTGESYAGIYIQMLAGHIVNDENSPAIQDNLKGLAVGDGCIGTETGYGLAKASKIINVSKT